jgi:hypothetical protein
MRSSFGVALALPAGRISGTPEDVLGEELDLAHLLMTRRWRKAQASQCS